MTAERNVADELMHCDDLQCSLTLIPLARDTHLNRPVRPRVLYILAFVAALRCGNAPTVECAASRRPRLVFRRTRGPAGRIELAHSFPWRRIRVRVLTEIILYAYDGLWVSLIHNIYGLGFLPFRLVV